MAKRNQKKRNGTEQLEDTRHTVSTDSHERERERERHGALQPKRGGLLAEVEIAFIIQINDDVLFDVPALDLLRHI